MNATCPWCSAPRDAGPTCPRCGADYAKAEAIRKFGRASASASPASSAQEMPQVRAAPVSAVIEEPPDVDDPALEFKFCLAAIPVMLLLGIAFNAFNLGHFLQRTFLSMPIHELGHAVASWLTGHMAIPTLWKTITFDRGIVMPLLMFAAAGALLYRGWSTGDRTLLGGGAVIAVLQFWGSLLVSDDTADMLIVFGGDAGGMVLGTMLMATFFFGKKTQLYKGSLRWGFIAIGAAAYVDIVSVWLSARRDRTNIPFGEIEGVGHSDALRLSTQWGWSDAALVNRHLGVALACFIALAAIYAWGVRQAWKATQPSQDD